MTRRPLETVDAYHARLAAEAKPPSLFARVRAALRADAARHDITDEQFMNGEDPLTASTVTPDQPQAVPHAPNPVLDQCWEDLVEKVDRTSPEDYPDMALITREELAAYLAIAARPVLPAETLAEGLQAWPIKTAPRNGTMVRLLIDFEGCESWCPMTDDMQSWTVGFNHFDHDEQDEWIFVGWNWSQDCIVDCRAPGHGKVAGWLPVASAIPGTLSGKFEDARPTLTDEQIIDLAVAHSNCKDEHGCEVFSHQRLIEFTRGIIAFAAAPIEAPEVST